MPGKGPPPSLKAATTVKFRARNFVSHRKASIKEHYEVTELLGSGGYGDVFVGLNLATKQERAIKVISKDGMDADDHESVLNEFRILKDLDHPNILKMYELFEDKERFCIITDIYRGGELFSEIEKYGYFSEEDTAQLMNNVLGCINYCHKRNLVHRDLKPENILLEQNMKLEDIKIIDFGLACTYNGTPMEDFAGSSYYASPQVYLGSYGPKADIWSCGVIAYVTMGGYAPFDGDTDEEIKEQILTGDFDFSDENWEGVDELALDFILSLLTYDEDERPTAQEALEHPFLVEHRQEATKEKSKDAARMALANLKKFHAKNKLQQAAYAIISSQLLEKDQKEKVDGIFRALDLDANGKIDDKELQQGFQTYLGQTYTDDDAQRMVRKINLSGSGAIEYSEFVVAALVQEELLDDKKLMAAFHTMDYDGDGKINADDVLKILGGIVDSQDGSTLHDYVKNKVLKQVSMYGDGDGVLGLEEFKDMMLDQGQHIVDSQPIAAEEQSIAVAEPPTPPPAAAAPPAKTEKPPATSGKEEGLSRTSSIDDSKKGKIQRKDSRALGLVSEEPARVMRNKTKLPPHSKRVNVELTSDVQTSETEKARTEKELEAIRALVGGTSKKKKAMFESKK